MVNGINTNVRNIDLVIKSQIIETNKDKANRLANTFTEVRSDTNNTIHSSNTKQT